MLLAVVAIAAGPVFEWAAGSAAPAGESSTYPSDATAREVLATLPVKGREPSTGYDREGVFGSAWLDVDDNGCDTRNDILARDLTDITKSGPCRVMTGELVSPFDTSTVEFVRGEDTSELVQIDHVVALSNAWQTGAQALTQEQRISFANDPLNLLAVDGASNSAKGAGDTATWLPANRSFRCEYVARQVSVKATYRLWVTRAERDAMQRVLATCPGQPASPPRWGRCRRVGSRRAVRLAGRYSPEERSASVIPGQSGRPNPLSSRAIVSRSGQLRPCRMPWMVLWSTPVAWAHSRRLRPSMALRTLSANRRATSPLQSVDGASGQSPERSRGDDRRGLGMPRE
nr:HNH endonuclease family protein [Marisediminicola senii]